MAVTPEEFARVVPEYAALRPDAWVRLIAHELAHGWYQELAGPRRLGPAWFVEGFAIIASDQGFGEELKFGSAEGALAPIDWNGRYADANAAACLRFFLQRASMAKLIERAGSPDFEAWLRALPGERSAQGASTPGFATGPDAKAMIKWGDRFAPNPGLAAPCYRRR